MVDRLTHKQCRQALQELGVSSQVAREYTKAIGGGLLSIASEMSRHRWTTNEGTIERDQRYQLEAFVAEIVQTEPENVTHKIEGAARARLCGINFLTTKV